MNKAELIEKVKYIIGLVFERVISNEEANRMIDELFENIQCKCHKN